MMDVNCLEKRIAELFGITSYTYIQDTFRNVDVSKDLEFQRIFNGYYVVRRNKEWRDIYYSIFEKVKNAPNQCSFEYVIRELYEQTGNIEASFTSKMLATIDTRNPIYDKYVLNNLGIVIKSQDKQSKIDECIRAYERIKEWYDSFLESDDSKQYILKFNTIFPEYVCISDVKKIDFFLWSNR